MENRDKKYISKQVDEIIKILSWEWDEKDLIIYKYLKKINKRMSKV